MSDNKLLREIAEAIVKGEVTPSTSAVQRGFGITKGEAMDVVFRLESLKVISDFKGNEPRKVLVNLVQLNQIIK